MANRKKQNAPAPTPVAPTATFGAWQIATCFACAIALVSLGTAIHLSTQIGTLNNQLAAAQTEQPATTGVTAEQLAAVQAKADKALAQLANTLRTEQRSAVSGLARKSELDGLVGSADLAELRVALDRAKTQGFATTKQLAAATFDIVRRNDLDSYATKEHVANATAKATHGVVREGELAAATGDVVRRKDIEQFATRSDVITATAPFATKAALTAATRHLARKADLRPFATKNALTSATKNVARKKDLAGFATRTALTNLATKAALAAATKNVARKTDLSNFATRSALTGLVRRTDLTRFASKTELEPFATRAALAQATKGMIGRDDLKKVIVGMMKMTQKIVDKQVAGVGRKVDASRARIQALEKELNKLAKPKGSPVK